MNADQRRFLAAMVLLIASVSFGAVLYKGVFDPPLDDLGRPQLFFGVFEAY